VLAFTDNGPGFAPEIIAHAFEPYVTNKAKGTGLGLAIVKKIISEHGGEVDVESSSDGTTFTLTMPQDDAKG
jgi:two-component system, NtrC family, nitrogen regulation sensor histidine kinase NtrY